MSNDAIKVIGSRLERYDAIQQECILELVKVLSSYTEEELDHICDRFGIRRVS